TCKQSVKTARLEGFGGHNSTGRHLPRSHLSRAENGFDHRHVPDRVFEGNWDFPALSDGSRENVALDRVLIARRESFCADVLAENIAAVVNENTAGAIVWRVEWNLNLDATLGSQKVHPLIRHKLGTAGENGLSRWEVEHRRGQTVCFHIGITLENAHHTRGFLAKNEARGRDRIAANVHQPTASSFKNVADVVRITIEVAKEPDDGTQRANPAGLN